ncbi:ubx domain-containing protein [Ophiostoma piceae UAMH 11346]|uniref:Ubx domain-containing protein n=1 Tax=Ophiostoma piceae (strain UAMH 11346) TaxID=1262450 RepID=S3CS22_OPHP1|nr:ubx domain-containing protein [Ophiostoma piceae UAMH 11346]
MATSFVVIATDLRRTTVKAPGGGYMIDVLEEACTKLKLNAENFQLKHNNKAINLTDPIRASGLPQGAKLELIVKSKSPSVVTVALRLPPSEAALGIPSNRVSAKVRSDTPLWKLLRHFEEQDVGKQKGLNLSARGVPRLSHGGAIGGSGQLYWEVPVLKFAGRELVSIDDYRKTLSQVGIDTGSQLIMVEFRISDYTLQEAMELVQTELEKSDGGEAADKARTTAKGKAVAAPEAPASTETGKATTPAPEQTQEPEAMDVDTSPALAPAPVSAPTQPTQPPSSSSQPQPPRSSLQPVQVWSPPKAGMPAAASLRWAKEADSTFAPSIAQMKAHQRHLEDSGRNKRLKSDQEIEEEARERENKASAVSKVDVRIRFPDGYTVLWSFAGNGPEAATGATLYAAVRGVLADHIKSQPFRLAPPMFRPGEEIQDNADATKHGLVRGYGMRGGVVINFLRGQGVPALPAGKLYVRPEVTAMAQDIVIPQVEAEVEEDKKPVASSSTADGQDGAKKTNKGDGINKMSKFLRLSKK